MTYLLEVDLFGDTHALFPKAAVKVVEKRFQNVGFARLGCSSGVPLNVIIKGAFSPVQIPPTTMYLFRKTMSVFGARIAGLWRSVRQIDELGTRASGHDDDQLHSGVARAAT